MKNNDLTIPNHVAIILDGNGRWASSRGLPRSKGHDAGFKNFKKLTKYVFNKGVKVFSVFAFSTENFKRDKKEVDYLMQVFIKACHELIHMTDDNDVKVVFSGSHENLSDAVIKSMKTVTDKTSHKKSAVLNICLNYGGKKEIVDTARKMCELGIEITEENFSKHLYQDLPPVDFLIRTSGELRISNFMIFQSAYAELYFPEVYFPDFNSLEFDKALMEFNKRERRFGGVSHES